MVDYVLTKGKFTTIISKLCPIGAEFNEPCTLQSIWVNRTQI